MLGLGVTQRIVPYNWPPVAGPFWALRADTQVTFSGSSVTQWNDQSSSGSNTVSQTVASGLACTRGATINHWVAMSFNGSQAEGCTTPSMPAGAKTFCIVYQLQSTGISFASAFTMSTSGYSELVFCNSSGYLPVSFAMDFTSTTAVGLSGVSLDTQPHCLVVTWDGGGSTSSHFTATLDGVAKTVATSGALGRTASVASIGGRLSTSNVLQDGANISIADLLAYSGVMSSTNQTIYNNYATARYGV